MENQDCSKKEGNTKKKIKNLVVIMLVVLHMRLIQRMIFLKDIIKGMGCLVVHKKSLYGEVLKEIIYIVQPI